MIKTCYVVVCIEDLFTTTYRLLPQTPIYIFLSLFYHPHINSPLYLVTNLTTFSSWVRTSKQECQNVKNCSKLECLKVGGGGGGWEILYKGEGTESLKTPLDIKGKTA